MVMLGPLRRRRLQFEGPSAAARIGYGINRRCQNILGAEAQRLERTWNVAAWEITHLGSCHLGKKTLGKWPLRKNPFGKVPNIGQTKLYGKVVKIGDCHFARRVTRNYDYSPFRQVVKTCLHLNPWDVNNYYLRENFSSQLLVFRSKMVQFIMQA